MKKTIIFILLLFIPLTFGGCMFSATSGVMNYNYDKIISLQIFCVQNSSGVQIEDEDKILFYNGARKLDFVMPFDFDEKQGLEYDYYFFIKYQTFLFVKQETFVLKDNMFYNQSYKRTLGTDNQFIQTIQQIFEKAWLKKISEV